MAKINYFASLFIVLVLSMHTIACVWLYMGNTFEGTWITKPGDGFGHQDDVQSQYITSIYWTITTLTTVGYGDVKGYT